MTMPWDELQQETFEWAVKSGSVTADAILQADGDDAVQLPWLREAWMEWRHADRAGAETAKSYHLAGTLLAGEWLDASEIWNWQELPDQEDHMTATDRRPLAQAERDANDFKALFAGTYSAWAVAGSIRRRRPHVKDAELIVCPLEVPVTGGGLFTTGATANAVWQRLDALVGTGELAKAVYVDKNDKASQRWGSLYRGVLYRGMKHEVYMATVGVNWGAQLTIRTGPWEFSRRIVDIFKTGGKLRQQDGNLIDVATGAIVPVPTEEKYFELAGLDYQLPHERT